MKRFLPLLAVAALVAVPAASARPAARPTLQSGKLIVAFGDPAPGFANGTVRGSKFTNPRGYEVDLATAIAAKLGVTPVWMYSPWTSLFAPGTKKFDISFQEATITAQRKRTVDFTTSYLNANQGVLLSKQTPAPHEPRRPEEAADLRAGEHDGPRLDQDAAAAGEEAARRIRRRPPRTSPCRSTAARRSSSTCRSSRSQKKQKPAAYGPVAGQIVTHEQYGAVLQKGSKLLAAVNTDHEGPDQERHGRRSSRRSGSTSTSRRSRS